jgi:hypothetical protein
MNYFQHIQIKKKHPKYLALIFIHNPFYKFKTKNNYLLQMH